MFKIKIDHTLCYKDGLCIKECPAFVLIQGKDGYPKDVEEFNQMCINCGHCLAVCPNHAISHKNLTSENCLESKHIKVFSKLEVTHFLRKRRSIRQYKDLVPEKALIKSLLKVAKYSPSARNLQPVNWIVIKGKYKVNFIASLVLNWMKKEVKKNKMPHFERIISAWEKGEDRILRSAPTLLIGHANKSYNYAMVDIVTSISYIELASISYGLGSCWAGYFTSASKKDYDLIKYINLPENHIVHGAIMLGFPDVKYYRMPERENQNIIWG